jgi:hypothetical protein
MYRVFAVAFVVMGFYAVNYYWLPAGNVAARLGVAPFQEARQVIAGGQVHVEASGQVVQGIDRLLKRIPLKAEQEVLLERVGEARIGVTQFLGEQRDLNAQVAATLKRVDGQLEEGLAGLRPVGDLAAAMTAETARRAMFNVLWGLFGCAVLYPLAVYADATSQSRRVPFVR